MLGPDVVVVETPGLLLCEAQDTARSLGELIEPAGPCGRLILFEPAPHSGSPLSAAGDADVLDLAVVVPTGGANLQGEHAGHLWDQTLEVHLEGVPLTERDLAAKIGAIAGLVLSIETEVQERLFAGRGAV